MPRFTVHAFERWLERVDGQATKETAAEALSGALDVPRRLWPYLRIGPADEVLCLPETSTATGKGVLFVVREGWVVTCFAFRNEGQRVLLRRALRN